MFLGLHAHQVNTNNTAHSVTDAFVNNTNLCCLQKKCHKQQLVWRARAPKVQDAGGSFVQKYKVQEI